MNFICSHCGCIAEDTTTAILLDDGCTLICTECGGLTKVTLTPIAGDVAGRSAGDVAGETRSAPEPGR